MGTTVSLNIGYFSLVNLYIAQTSQVSSKQPSQPISAYAAQPMQASISHYVPTRLDRCKM